MKNHFPPFTPRSDEKCWKRKMTPKVACGVCWCKCDQQSMLLWGKSSTLLTKPSCANKGFKLWAIYKDRTSKGCFTISEWPWKPALRRQKSMANPLRNRKCSKAFMWTEGEETKWFTERCNITSYRLVSYRIVSYRKKSDISQQSDAMQLQVHKLTLFPVFPDCQSAVSEIITIQSSVNENEWSL